MFQHQRVLIIVTDETFLPLTAEMQKFVVHLHAGDWSLQHLSRRFHIVEKVNSFSLLCFFPPAAADDVIHSNE